MFEKIGICWHCKKPSINLRSIIMTASKSDETHEVNVCKFCEGLLVRAQDHEPKKEPDPLIEIEELFDEIKEFGIITSAFAEQREIIASNLMVAYYLNKLERKLK